MAQEHLRTRVHPRVSIGLPVFNGQDFLAEALDALLDQTFADFEVIVSDNSSTDATSEICRAYAARDPRFRYYRSERNMGAGWNFNRTVHLASGEYFKWAAHDDVIEPTFIEKCVDLLDRSASVVLCFSWLVDIDEHGNELQVRKVQEKTHSGLAQPHERFWGLVRRQHTCEEVFGLVRTNVLKRTKLIENYSDSDRTLLVELGLHGPFHEIPEVLFRHRLHRRGSVAANPGWQERMAWFDPRLEGKLVFPAWLQLFGLLTVIWRSPISGKERLYCMYPLLRWLNRERPRLWGELVWAARSLSGRMARHGTGS